MPIRQSLIVRLILTALVLGIGIGAVWENNFAYWLIGGFGAFALALSVVARNKIIYLTGILLLVFCFERSLDKSERTGNRSIAYRIL